ncbi:hypothetical protein Tco_0294445 [Tanacetum coccineum]
MFISVIEQVRYELARPKMQLYHANICFRFWTCIFIKKLWDEDQTVIRNKARLVAKGYAQEEGPSLGLASGDELWAARYILEIAGVVVSFYNKPIPIDRNGVGAHTNYREEGGYEIIKMAIEKLGMRHKELITAYGEGNECRLTGRHETADINTFKWVDWNDVGAYLYIKSLHSIIRMIPGADLHQFDVHNDGYFAHLPLNYVDGVVLEMAVPRMSVSDDRSTSYMFDVEEIFGRLTLYLDYLDMNLSEYLSQAITYDMDALAEMEVETEGVEARTSTKNSVEARNSNTKGVEARTGTKDKGKEKVSEDASDVVETRRCTVEVNSETEYESDDDSDYQSDKLVDYLSPDEDELIELKNRMKANRKAQAKAKDKPDEEMNEPNKENSMPTDNVRGETFEEHDIYMNELLKSLKTADKDGITEDHFISVEKYVERYPMYDETTHQRLRKPQVGEKYTSVAQFKECLTYYASENSFSLWLERSGEVRVIARCGQRPPRVSDPNKGKLRKQTKYPCASSDELPKCPWRCYARANPDIRLCDIADLVMKKYKWMNKPQISSCKELVVEQTPKPKGVVGRPRKKQPVDDFMDVDVDQRVRDEGASGTRGGGIGSRGRGGRGVADGSRGGASGSIGRGAAGSRGVAGGSGGANELEQTQDEPEQTQAKPQQTQHEPEQTQVKEQIEQTEDQAEIDLTQVEQTQEQTHEQVQPQEQPQQVALRMPSARILQMMLGKQGSSENTALNLD